MRLLTWNIQWGRGSDGRVDLGRIADAARGFDADVICMQEVAVNHPGLPGGAAENQPHRLRELFSGYEAIYGVGSDISDGQGGRRQFGELILSRLPVLQAFRHLLPWPVDPAVPSMPRVAVEAVIAVPGGPLRIITTHLEYYSSLQRRAQVEALRAIHAEGWRHARAPRSAAETDPPFAVLPRGEATLLCGDFNFAPDTPEYLRLQEAFEGELAGTPQLVDAWSLANPQATHAPTAGLQKAAWIAVPACYDFCFIGADAARKVRRMFVDAATEASDHQPVILDLVAEDASSPF